jgi:repressor LexA
MDDLTPRQREVLDFLCTYQTQHQMPPTRADIARHFGFASANAAEDHLKALDRKGFIELRAGRARGIFINRSARVA